MSKIKLNQIVAIEKGVKSRVYSEVTQLHKKAQKEDLFNGLKKSFEPLLEDEPARQTEEKLVQLRWAEVLEDLRTQLTELFDVTATKDWGNMVAKADVVVDDKILVVEAPVPYLLFVEKQLNDINTFVEKMPILNPSVRWSPVDGSTLFTTDTLYTNSTRKVPEVVVKYDATKEHPAQTELVSLDKVVGRYATTQFSGAFDERTKAQLLKRITALKQAVQQARERANSTGVERVNPGKEVFDYLFG